MQDKIKKLAGIIYFNEWKSQEEVEDCLRYILEPGEEWEEEFEETFVNLVKLSYINNKEHTGGSPKQKLTDKKEEVKDFIQTQITKARTEEREKCERWKEEYLLK